MKELLEIRRAARPMAALLAASMAALMAGCAGAPPGLVTGPTLAMPMPPPAYVERPNNGAIYQPSMTAASLFSGERPPRSIGDTLKVDIAESLSASNKVHTDTSRENKVASKGPGSSQSSGFFNKILNLDASASGSDSYKGDGSTENSSSFTGRIAASVINVLPNGHLVVAGERSIALNGGQSTLRFSGIVNPRDIGAGNVVASGDVVNARLELAGRGDVSDASRRSWLQRVLTSSLSVW